MRRLTRTLKSLCWTGLLLVGIPAGLIHLAGWPLPAHLPTGGELAGWVRQPLTRTTVVAAALGVAWLMWAALLAAALCQAYTHAARLCRLPRIHPPAVLQGLSAAMLGTVAVSSAAAGATPPPAPAPITTIHVDHPTSPVLAGHRTAATPADAPALEAGPGLFGHTTVQAGAHRDTATVRPGDTLSGIAADRLGDANRWPEIFALNRGIHFSDVGGTLTDPDLIFPGWTLQLPDDAAPPPAATPPAPTPLREQPGAGQPAPPAGPAMPTASPTIAPASPATVASSSPTGNDGVAEPDMPAGSTPPHGSTPTPRGSTSDAPAASRSAHTPPGVSLPGGSWLDMGLVAAVLAAVTLVWTHRRRRYTPRPPSAQLRLDDPDLAPMPPVVNQVRRGLRRSTADPEDPTDPNGIAAEDVAEENATEPVPTQRPAPAVPALNNPLSAVWPPAGLGLTGPGADAAARGFLAAALAAGGLDDPDARSRVVMPSATAATLLAAAAVTLPDTPRLTVTAGLGEALEILEAQTLHRTRLVYRHEVDDVAALRQADTFEVPLPPIVLVADAAAHHERARIAALLSQGQRLDIHGILLGAWPEGNTVVVATDGTATAADGEAVRHGSHPADVGRLAVLTPTETADLLATLAESHTGLRQTPAPTEPAPASQTAAVPAPTVGADHDGAAKQAAGASGDSAQAAATSNGPVEQALLPIPAAPASGASPTVLGEDTLTAPGPTATMAAAGGDADDNALPAGPGRVEVAVLGAPAIVDADPTRSLRAKSLELLVYLTVHDGDASQEAILDDLLPEAPASKAPHRLHTYVSDLRKTLRNTGGPGNYLTHPPHRYALNREAVDIDLWRMRHALREAEQATDDEARLVALRRAVDISGGPLAQGVDYEWIEPYREAVRQQALDACLALAEALQGQPHEALAVLEAAIAHNPYAEPLYQAAMRARAALGHLDAIRTLRRTLTRRLAEIDAEPSQDTITLADQLVAGLQRPTRRSGLRPAPRPGDGTPA